MDEAAVLAAGIGAELPDGFEERERFDVADRATDLDEDDVDVLAGAADRLLDGVGHVGNDLDGAAEIVAAALAGEDRVVDLAGGHVVDLAEASRGEAFIVPEVEIGLGAVFGDVDLAVLEGIHRPGVDVQVGVELQERDAEAARFEQGADRSRREALAERRHHAARHEDVLGRSRTHSGTPLIAIDLPVASRSWSRPNSPVSPISPNAPPPPLAPRARPRSAPAGSAPAAPAAPADRRIRSRASPQA